MRPLLLALALLLTASVAYGQDDAPPADSVAALTEAHARIYTADGTPATFEDVIAAAREVDVVAFGEQHNDPVAHALQLRLLRALAEQAERPVVLSLEMFERDVQIVLDEYLAGLIRERDLLAAARPWSNYATDYRPLVEFARERGLPVLAANAPGRYVSLVGREGSEALAELPEAAQAWLPPLPIAPPSEALAAKFNAWMEAMAHAHAPAADTTAADTTAADTTAADTPAAVHGSATAPSHLLAAQNLRDATMGHAVATYLEAHPDALVLHLNGSFHSEGGLGVPEHIGRYRPGTRVLTLTAEAGEAFPDVDPARREAGDAFVVVTDPARQP